MQITRTSHLRSPGRSRLDLLFIIKEIVLWLRSKHRNNPHLDHPNATVCPKRLKLAQNFKTLSSHSHPLLQQPRRSKCCLVSQDSHRHLLCRVVTRLICPWLTKLGPAYKTSTRSSNSWPSLWLDSLKCEEYLQKNSFSQRIWADWRSCRHLSRAGSIAAC